jgi:hypothetical protein
MMKRTPGSHLTNAQGIFLCPRVFHNLLCQKVILSDGSLYFIVLKTVMVNLFIFIQLQQLQLHPLVLLRI